MWTAPGPAPASRGAPAAGGSRPAPQGMDRTVPGGRAAHAASESLWQSRTSYWYMQWTSWLPAGEPGERSERLRDWAARHSSRSFSEGCPRVALMDLVG